jgi:hypothetical protein
MNRPAPIVALRHSNIAGLSNVCHTKVVGFLSRKAQHHAVRLESGLDFGDCTWLSLAQECSSTVGPSFDQKPITISAVCGLVTKFNEAMPEYLQPPLKDTGAEISCSLQSRIDFFRGERGLAARDHSSSGEMNSKEAMPLTAPNAPVTLAT